MGMCCSHPEKPSMVIDFSHKPTASLEKDIKQLSAVGKKVKQVIDGMFFIFDEDHNEYLDRGEILVLLNKTFDQQNIKVPLTNEYLDAVFAEFDTDNNKNLDKDEMCIYFDKLNKQIIYLMNEELARRKRLKQ